MTAFGSESIIVGYNFILNYFISCSKFLNVSVSKKSYFLLFIFNNPEQFIVYRLLDFNTIHCGNFDSVYGYIFVCVVYINLCAVVIFGAVHAVLLFIMRGHSFCADIA